MDDYIRRNEAIDEINKALDRETLLNSFVRKIAVEAVKKMPSADAVEVVRCKDCKKYDTHDHRCKHWNHGVVVMDYCSRGERKDG